jgi:hypothetical protein
MRHLQGTQCGFLSKIFMRWFGYIPDLQSRDIAVKSAAWEAFERSPFSEPYRVGKITRGIVRNGIIGVPNGS